MKQATIFIIVVFAFYNCATQKTAQNNPSTIEETPVEQAELQEAPNSLDEEAPAYMVHIVQSGESLSIIAGKYGVTVEDLVSINDIADPDLIVIGQEILVPKPKPEDSL